MKVVEDITTTIDSRILFCLMLSDLEMYRNLDMLNNTATIESGVTTEKENRKKGEKKQELIEMDKLFLNAREVLKEDDREKYNLD
jgi:hypothetical protein